MQLYFAGAEVSSHLSILKECGVERIAVNTHNLVRATNNSENLGKWASSKRLSNMEWVLYADSPQVPADPALEVLQGAEVQPEIVTGPITWYEGTWLANTDLLFLPVWDAVDPTILRDYTENYDGVTLPDAVVDNPVAVRQARASINKLGQLAAITGRSKGIERFDTLVSSAWWNVQKYGETQVWAANRLLRLNADDKRIKREKYASSIDALGVDVAKILDDDMDELLRLAVFSWLALERHLVRGLSTAVVPASDSEVANRPTSMPHNVVPINPGVARPTPLTRHHLLPVMGTSSASETRTDEDGNEVDITLPVISVTPESLRQCNTCTLAIGCPMFTPNSPCSYQIPVEIKTKTQLVGVLRAITEIQTQRILMGRFGEEVQGEHSPELGKEMDRLFSMVERWRNIEDSRDSLKITVDSKGDAKAGMGVLSRLFGAQVGQNATMLETPVTSDEIIAEMTEDE